MISLSLVLPGPICIIHADKEVRMRESEFNPTKLKYYTISPKPFNNNAPSDIHKKAFTHWKDFWGKEYSSYGSNLHLNPMDFYRQDIYTFITYDDEIIGTNSLTFFDLSYDLTSYPYLSFMYPEETLDYLRSKNVSNIMTLQFLMVDPRFRYKITKLNLAGVIVSLSIKHQSLYNISGTLTAARTEVRAADVATKCGFTQISKEKLVHNVPVVSMFCEKPGVYPNGAEELVISRLWKNRNNFQEGENYEIKRAA